MITLSGSVWYSEQPEQDGQNKESNGIGEGCSTLDRWPMGPSAFYVVFSILMKLVKSWVGRCWTCGWWMVLTLLFIAVIVSREKADHCGTAIYAGAKSLLRQISRSSIHPIHPSSRQCIIINDTFWQVATCPS